MEIYIQNYTGMLDKIFALFILKEKTSKLPPEIVYQVLMMSQGYHTTSQCPTRF